MRMRALITVVVTASLLAATPAAAETWVLWEKVGLFIPVSDATWKPVDTFLSKQACRARIRLKVDSAAKVIVESGDRIVDLEKVDFSTRPPTYTYLTPPLPAGHS
jgi:hypothetical protein